MAYFFIVFHAFDTPVRRSLSEYCDAIRYEETRMVSLPDDEKSLRICLTVSTEYRRVTDRQTDGRTDRHLSTAYSAVYAYVSRCKNRNF